MPKFAECKGEEQRGELTIAEQAQYGIDDVEDNVQTNAETKHAYAHIDR